MHTADAAREERAEQGATPDWAAPLAQGQLSEAQRRHLEAVALEAAPDRAAEQVTRALEHVSELRAHLRAKRWREARRAADAPELSALEPHVDVEGLRSEVAQLEQGGQLLERGQPEEALSALSGVSLPLLRAEAETQRGTAHAVLGQSEAAERAFAEALERDPQHYRALTNRGNVALEAGRVDDAIRLYEGALKLNEGFANAHHNLGVAYRRKGQVSRSVASIRRAQRSARQSDREEARRTVRALGGGGRLKWLLYALLALGLWLLLRAQGVL